jgi:hypothetical protein
MHIHRSNKFLGVVVHVSDAVYREAQEIVAGGPSLDGNSIEEVFDHQYEEMFFAKAQDQFLEFVRLHGVRRGCSEIHVLNAHGGNKDGKWIYEDRSRSFSLQTWIDRHAKQAAAIVLTVCNADGLTVASRHTPLFIPDNIVGIGLAFLGEYHYTMRLPSGEEVDRYTIDYHLKQIRKKTKADS